MNIGVGKLIGVAVFALLALATFVSGWYTVDEGFRGVITRNGAVIGEAGPGFGWKMPFIDSVHDMSVRTVVTRWGDQTAMQAY